MSFMFPDVVQPPPFLSLLILFHLQRKTAEKAEKTSRAKGKKDPKAPKRALSAYMFFSQDWRERIKAENPDAGFGEAVLLLRFAGTLANQTRVQVKSASSSEQSGRSWTTRRRRYGARPTIRDVGF